VDYSQPRTPPVAPMSRRRVLRVALGAAALFLLQGCRSSSSSKELNKSKRELRRTLDELAQDEPERSRLAKIAEKIIDAVAELLEENEAFLSSFHGQSVNPDVTADELRETVTAFEARRKRLRDAALRAQDELRAELTAEEWAEAVAVLNRKAAIAAQPPWED
jgi:hypothetical protein